MTPRVLALTRYDRAGASSRVRVYQYLPWLERRGLEVNVVPLFDATYLERLYDGQPTAWIDIVSAYARRIQLLASRPRVDLIWIEYELLPWLPWLIERALLPRRTRFLVEFDDAVFHRYDLGRPFVRALLGRKLDQLMAKAWCVVAGNAYLAERAHRAGARRVEIVPSVVDLEEYPAPAGDSVDGSAGALLPEHPVEVDVAGSHGAFPDDATQSALFTVGWLGSPSTTRYVQSLAPVFERLTRSGPLKVVVVGASPITMPGVRLEQRTWSKATEAQDIYTFDVGVMPLNDTPWERGKCGFKLIQYMACGRPVVASPVGVNVELAVPSLTGALASTPDEWVRALEVLRDDAGLRRRLGAAGRALVERSYSLQVTGPLMADLLNEAASVAAPPSGRTSQ